MISPGKICKYLALILCAILLISLLWYTPSRLLREENRIKYYNLSLNEPLPGPSDPNLLRLGCYNIAHARGGELGASNWQYSTTAELKRHLDAIADQIKQQNLDIVVLNEVDFKSAWSLHFNQAEYIARQAGYTHIVEQRNMDVSLPFADFQFGNSILSRHPVISTEFVKLPPLSRLEDFFVGNHDSMLTLLQTPVGKVGVLAIHLDYRDEKIRVQCANHIAKRFDGLGFPIIAAGDFNSAPPSPVRSDQLDNNAITYLTNRGNFRVFSDKTDKTTVATFPSVAPKMAIDWIMVRGKLEIFNTKVIPSYLSDHFMVVASLKPDGKKGSE